MRRTSSRWAALLVSALLGGATAIAAPAAGDAPAVPQRVRPIEAQLFDDLETLATESGIARLPHALPASDAELAALLSLLDEESLSAAGKRALARVKAELATPTAFSRQAVGVDVSLVLQPEGNWRTSLAHPFRRDYARRPALLRVPLALSFGPHLYAFVEPAWKQDPNAVVFPSQSGVNVVDLARNPLETDTHFPFRAFLSAGGDLWRFTLGRDRLSLGNAGDDNLVLSSNVPFHDFARLVLFLPWLRMTSLVSQLHTARYLYLHRIDLLAHERLSVSLTEATLVGHGPLELRHMSPMMIFHGLLPWDDYDTDDDGALDFQQGTGTTFGLDVSLAPLPRYAIHLQLQTNALRDPVKRYFLDDDGLVLDSWGALLAQQLPITPRGGSPSAPRSTAAASSATREMRASVSRGPSPAA